MIVIKAGAAAHKDRIAPIQETRPKVQTFGREICACALLARNSPYA